MNEDFTLTTFAEPITDLADEPQLPADEMKRRLQAPADELRQAHNALAQTVHGITEATYPDTVTEAMLTNELAAKINGKADADDVTALDDRLDTVETALPTKCEVYAGQYVGNSDESQTIDLGFQPKAVLVTDTAGTMHYEHTAGNHTYTGGLALPNAPVITNDLYILSVCANGFTVFSNSYKVGSSYYSISTNQGTHYYIALK